MIYAKIILIGFFAGICSGLFGVGGGIIIVPMLVLTLNYSQHMANGTSLVALLLPVGFLGAYQYYLNGFITSENIKLGIILAVGIFFGAYGGSYLASLISPLILKKLFAIFLFLTSIKLFFF